MTLTYASAGQVKHCGSGGQALALDLLAWVIESAEPWDIIDLDGGGMFVRVRTPLTSA